MFTKLRYIIFLFLAILQLQNLWGQTPYFREIEDRKIEDALKINSIFQDKLGYIWLGTTNGLFQYDGYNLIQHPHAFDNVSNTISAITEDSEGNLWLGLESGKILIFDGYNFEKFSFNNQLPNEEITQLVFDKDSTLWIATYGKGIYYNEENEVKSIDTKDGLSDDFVYTLSFAGDGRILVGSDGGIDVIKFDGNEKVIVNVSSVFGLPDEIVRVIKPAGDGKFWIGMQDEGVCLFHLSEFKFEIPESFKNWNYGTVKSIVTLNGELWIGTSGKGIISYSLNENIINSINKNVKTELKGINFLLKDRQNNVWIGTNNGLKYSPGNSILFLKNNNKTNTNALAILRDSNGKIWLSNQSGLFYYSWGDPNKKDVRKYNFSKKLPSGEIISMYEDTFGYIWFGTYGSGLYRFNPDNNNIQVFTVNEGLPSGDILSITGNGFTIWLSTLEGVSKVKLPKRGNQDKIKLTFENFSKKDGLGNNFIYYTYIDSKERVWIATDGKGLTKLENGKFTVFGKEQGLNSAVVYSITEDNKGNIWCSGQNDGVYKYNGKSFINYGLNEGLRDLSVKIITTDKFGNIVIGHKRGIDLLNSETNRFNYFGGEVGLINFNPFLNAFSKDQFGNIWIGTSDGVIKYNPLEEVHSQMPNIHLRDIKVMLNSYIPQQSNVFPYNENHFTFNFPALWYVSPEKVRYKYILENFDLEWINTIEMFSNYSNLTPGIYTFRVKASVNGNFDNAEETNFSFEIKPPLWKTNWFILLATIIIISGMYAFTKIKQRNLKNLNELLELRVQNRTNEILQKKEEIKTQAEKLKAANEVIVNRNKEIENAQALVQKKNQELSEANELLNFKVFNRTRELRKALKELDYFIYRSAHDLRGPVVRLIGLCQLMETETDIKKINVYIEKFKITSLDMNNLLSKLLQTHEINTKELEIEEINLNETVASVYECLNDKTNFDKIDFNVDIQDDVKFFSDQLFVNNILKNLFENSIDYLDPNKFNHYINVDIHFAKENYCIISVKDNGIGIAQKLATKVFSMFYRGTTLSNGHGLGLYVVKSLIKRLNGEIRINLMNKKETEFVIFLPRKVNSRDLE